MYTFEIYIYKFPQRNMVAKSDGVIYKAESCIRSIESVTQLI